MHTYEVRPRKDHRGVDLISDALPFGRLWNRARIVFDCRMTDDPAMISSKNAAHVYETQPTVIQRFLASVKSVS
jgi:hypothetical protein